MEKDDLIRKLDTINKLHDELGQFINQYSLEPSPNSVAYLELKNYRRPESLVTTYSQGNLLIEAAADHLIALTRDLTVGVWMCQD